MKAHRIVHHPRIIHDFLLADRRLAERSDIKIKLYRYKKGEENTVRGDFEKFRQGFYVKRMIHWTGQWRWMWVIAAAHPLSDSEVDLSEVLGSLVICFGVSGNAQSRSAAIGRVLKDVRESLEFSHTDVAEILACTTDVISDWEEGFQVPSEPSLYAWCQALGLVCPPNTALVRVVDFSPELLRFLQEDPTRLRSLTPDQFERFVAERMDRMGYNVTLTGASDRKDGGIDLIAAPKAANVGSIVIAGQVKHHCGDQKTGRDAVDRLLAWKDLYFGVGLLVTNTSFTRDAVWTAQQERNARFLRLRDFTDLKRWLEDRFGEEADWREIPDRIELAPGVVIEIPKPRIVSPAGLAHLKYRDDDD